MIFLYFDFFHINQLCSCLLHPGLELMCDERMRACKEDGEYPEYKRRCRKFRAVPNSYFLRHIMDEDMNIRFRYLGYGDSCALAQEILVSGVCPIKNRDGYTKNELLILNETNCIRGTQSEAKSETESFLSTV